MPQQADRHACQMALNSAGDILASFTRLVRQHARMEQALEFYANRAHYAGTLVDDDEGAVARAALNLETN